MQKKSRNIALVVLALAAVGAAFYVVSLQQYGVVDQPLTIRDDDGGSGGLQPMAPPKPRPAAFSEFDLTAQDLEFLDNVRSKFGPQIARKYVQIKALEQLIAYLMAKYPDDWQDRMYGFLKQLFPDLADALYERFQNLMRFNEWLANNRQTLMHMPAGERRAALWAARRDAFGPDAEEIFGAVIRNERVQEALASLETAEALTVDQKLASYLAAVREAYGDDADTFIQQRQTELMNGFLDVDAVQTDLRALPPDARSAQLREMRTAMGMDEAALSRWDELDRTRDRVWQAGKQYREERRRIESQYDGVEEERQIAQLQDRTFGEDAETIRNEEAAGFYRYDRERRIGRE